MFIYSINHTRMKNWFKEHLIYQRKQPVTKELSSLLFEFKESIKELNPLELEVEIEEIYKEEENLYFIYLLQPKGWDKNNPKGYGNISFNPNNIGYAVAINNQLYGKITFGFGLINSKRTQIYSESIEGQLERQEIQKEREEKKNQGRNHDAEIWRLKKAVTNHHLTLCSTKEVGIVYHYDTYDHFGFIVNAKGQEFYFNIKPEFAKNTGIQRYTIVEYTPKIRADGKTFAVELQVLMVSAISKEPFPNQYRTFGGGKRKMKKGHGGSLSNPWRAF
ncbi:hypothetical protein [Neobacillus drentensis]|uniref:hypothetical protein n=1 Tax=Neobacillus drentensis TaxID=220684 RepID=UPI002FFE4FBC